VSLEKDSRLVVACENCLSTAFSSSEAISEVYEPSLGEGGGGEVRGVHDRTNQEEKMTTGMGVIYGCKDEESIDTLKNSRPKRIALPTGPDRPCFIVKKHQHSHAGRCPPLNRAFCSGHG